MNLARAVILAVALATEAGAGATNLPGPPPGREMVAQCAAQVRAATPGSVFGAYIDPRTGDLRWFGSEQERSHFTRCLALRGASEQQIPKGATMLIVTGLRGGCAHASAFGELEGQTLEEAWALIEAALAASGQLRPSCIRRSYN